MHAKLVKTKPQVNEVLDDSSLIKRLQRELAEARKLAAGKEFQFQMQHFQVEAQNAAVEADEKIRRLKASFLKGGVLSTTLFGDFLHGQREPTHEYEVSDRMKKRRRSDGYTDFAMKPQGTQMTPLRPRPKTSEDVSANRIFGVKLSGNEKTRSMQPLSEAELLRDALHAKAQKNIDLQSEVATVLSKLEKAKFELTSAYD